MALLSGLLLCAFIVVSSGERDPEQVLNLFEGDIELTPQTGFRSTLNMKDRLWPNGVVPYEVHNPDGSITADQLRNLTQAMQNFHDNTCIRFVKKKEEDDHFITFVKGNGCSSNMGMIDVFELTGTKGQKIRLADGCFQLGKIQHEMMHALGFFHEQSRWDRDEYIRIIPHNIEQGKIAQFRKHRLHEQNKKLGAPYDYGSLMHYPSTAFSQDLNDKATIIPLRNVEIGQRRGFSQLDIWKINKLYKCKGYETELPVNLLPPKTRLEDEPLPYTPQDYFHCDFDYAWTCGMRDELNSTAEWRLGRGRNSKYYDTGPNAGTNGEECCYAYADSIARHPGDTAIIVSPVLKSTEGEDYCFRFYYHMLGSTIGSLDVYTRSAKTGEVIQKLLRKTGPQGSEWIRSNHLVRSDEHYEIVFVATFGGKKFDKYEGNIAIDDINYKSVERLGWNHLTWDEF